MSNKGVELELGYGRKIGDVNISYEAMSLICKIRLRSLGIVTRYFVRGRKAGQFPGPVSLARTDAAIVYSGRFTALSRGYFQTQADYQLMLSSINRADDTIAGASPRQKILCCPGS